MAITINILASGSKAIRQGCYPEIYGLRYADRIGTNLIKITD
jgi:hypothetical protein